MNEAAIARRKRADLLASAGAALAGMGAGALLGAALAPVAGALLLVGLAAHAVGMVGRHRLDRMAGESPPRWYTLLYRLCWVGMAAVALALLASAPGRIGR